MSLRDVAETFGHFVALPVPNDYAAACQPGGEPNCGGGNGELRFTTDAAGNVLLPWDYRGILRRNATDPTDPIPVARIGRGSSSIPAHGVGPGVRIPGRGFAASYSPEGFLLLPFFTPLPDARQDATLFGTIDAERGVMRLAQQSGNECSGGPFAGDPCTEDLDCSDGTTSGACVRLGGDASHLVRVPRPLLPANRVRPLGHRDRAGRDRERPV